MAHVIPSWAPNLHPLLVHFPIVLVLVAVPVDLLDASVGRPSWLGTAASSLYVLGAVAAVAAVLTGQHAADTVLLPGMAHPLVAAHRSWALATTGWCISLAALRLLVHARGVRHPRLRVALVGAGLVGAVLIWGAAERGARLVYEQGVGIVSGVR